MNVAPPPTSPTPATESDGEEEWQRRREDYIQWQTRRDDSDERSNIVLEALLWFDMQNDPHLQAGSTPQDIATACSYADVAYDRFRDQKPEYEDGDSDDGAVIAYHAFYESLTQSKKRRVRRCICKHIAIGRVKVWINGKKLG